MASVRTGMLLLTQQYICNLQCETNDTRPYIRMQVPGNKHALKTLTVGVVDCGSLKDWNLYLPMSLVLLLQIHCTDFNQLQ
jgi:hypothetical protein